MEDEFTSHELLRVGDRVRVVEIHPQDGYYDGGPSRIGHVFTIAGIDDDNIPHPKGFWGYDIAGADCYFAVRVLRISAAHEDADLCASAKACAVADAWFSRDAAAWEYGLPPGMQDALAALELATRSSPLRKVKP